MRWRTGSYSANAPGQVRAQRSGPYLRRLAVPAARGNYHRGMRFAKGHGTENDFVLLPDFEDDLALTPALVTRLCDRRAGVGGDGVLRVVLAAAARRAGGGNGRAGYGLDRTGGSGRHRRSGRHWRSRRFW